MRHNYGIEYDGIQLRPLERGDIELLRQWRNDPCNSQFIRKLPEITPEAQLAWFQAYLQDNSDITFAVCENDVLLGSVSLYDPDGSAIEFGHLMIGEAKGQGAGRRATNAVLKLAFEQMEYETVNAEVSVDNTAALIIYVRAGFCITGRRYSEKAQMDEFTLALNRNRFFALAE